MKRSRRTYLYNLIFSLFLLCFAVPSGSAQVTSIPGGTINSYSKVTAVGADWVELADNLPLFVADEKVLLIQMKGADLVVGGSLYGSLINNKAGDFGYYEFIIIDAVSTLPDRITFKNDLQGSYDADSYVQLVKLPGYQNVSIDGLLTCPPWDEASGTGGVLTFMADNNVYLNNNIDVSEKGFDGGISDVIQGVVITTAGVDPDLFDFTEADNRAARKGKGVSSHISLVPFNYDDYARGKGRFGSGGGGGNGEFAGGGGGASYGNGGVGGQDLSGSYGSGYGGQPATYGSFPYYPVVMGGGGGAGGKDSGGSDIASDGGRGGGIIILLADSIFGNGNSIISNGESVWPVADNNGGVGGGGAAGAIVISSNYSTSSGLTIASDGGNGGHTYNLNGFGGGGSAGLIYTNKNLDGSGVTYSMEPGEEGATLYSGLPTGTPSGQPGDTLDNLLIRLTGFLFNTIVSDVTKSRVDSICFGDSAPKIIGSEPTGGVGPYDIKWIRRKINDVVWDTIPGETGKDMDLTVAEDDTVFFKRVVFDANQSPKVIDVSKEVMVVVQPLITGNIIGYDTIICENQDPLALLPLDILGGGNFDSAVPDSSFSWRQSTVNNPDYHTWGLPVETNTERDFDPNALTTTTYYYRAVKSGRCYDTSNVVTVTVLPPITENSIEADQEVCEDSLFIPLNETATLSGGDGLYFYEWQVFNGTQFVAAAGTVDQPGYDPNQLSYTYNQDTLLRRYIYSGADSVCQDASDVITLKVWSDITDNIIYADQTTSEGDPVALLLGDSPGGGDTNVAESYEWQDSTRLSTWATAGGTYDQPDYHPPHLTDTTWYRRIVTRGDCEDISIPIVINVNPSISNNTIELLSGAKDTIICNDQDIILFEGSDPTGGDEVDFYYKWEKRIDNGIFEDADGVITNRDYDPPALTTPPLTVTTYYFRRIVTSGESTGISDTITITVLPDITGNTISGDQTICYNTGLLIPVTGPEPTGGDGFYAYLWEESTDNSTWDPASGINTNIDYDPGTLTLEMYYRRIATSGSDGCCDNTSNTIMVGIHDLPVGVISAISGNTYCAGDNVTITVDMSAAGQAPYDVVLGDGIGGTLSFTANTDIFDYTFNPASSGDFTDYVYQFTTLTDDNACVATNTTGTESLRVYTVPTASISTATVDNVCGDNVTLEATPSVGTGLWSCPDAAILSAASASTSATTSVTVDESATYTFTWTETNWTCMDAATIDITFWEQPDPVDAGPGETLLPLTTEYSLSATAASAGAGLWTAEPDMGQEFFPEDGNLSEVSGLVDGVNILRWTVTNGDYCLEVSDTIMLTITTLTVPSGFSPNQDGINDVFKLKGLDNDAVKAELIITDMAGVVVYDNKEYHNEWDGRNSTSGDYLPDGTYYYFLRIKEPDNRQYKGYVIIKRSIGKD